MSLRIALVFPHQLFLMSHNPALQVDALDEVWLIEHDLFFRQYTFHTHKLILHRASMKWYESYLVKSGLRVRYFESAQSREVRHAFRRHEVKDVHLVDVVDDWLLHDVREVCTGRSLTVHPSPQFIIPSDEVGEYKDMRLLEHFYRQLRKNTNILMQDGKPVGGVWNYDHSNRKPLPKEHTPTAPRLFGGSHWVQEASRYVEEHWPDNHGTSEVFWVPVTREEALLQLSDFLDTRLARFGPYEDAMHTGDGWVYHSTISSALNCGLLLPNEVLQRIAERYKNGDVPIESAEAVVRQILGWREFMRIMYVHHGRSMRTQNFFKHTNELPHVFWKPALGDGTPLGRVLGRVHKRAYAHHIERLMVLGSLALLTESNPNQVYQWFMEFFIDAYDWVMVPNIYDMSQFATGGVFATKPYISGAAYLKKMSNFPEGEWERGWTGLYWAFVYRNLERLQNNHRMRLICAQAQKHSAEKRKAHQEHARAFVAGLYTEGQAKNG